MGGLCEEVVADYSEVLFGYFSERVKEYHKNSFTMEGALAEILMENSRIKS
jgi:hypothetical protein